MIKHRLELYKSTLRQHTFYRTWSLWDRGLIYCIYHWKEESARKRVSAFPFACRQIDSDIWFFQGMMISPYVSLYLVTVYLTTCHRNWLGRLKPGKWNDFETKWNTSTNKHRDKYPKTVQWVYLMTRIKGIFLSLLWNNLLKVSCTFFTDLATSKSAWSLSMDVLC